MTKEAVPGFNFTQCCYIIPYKNTLKVPGQQVHNKNHITLIEEIERMTIMFSLTSNS